jgi:hypothetical protein
VATDRARRLALNEAAFRVANERMRAWPERRDHGDDPARYYCECADPACREQILLRAHEYEEVRADPHRFAVVPGHETQDVESVVRRTDRYAVIEKAAETHPLSEATDPRRED